MRLHGDHTAKREPSPEVIETGRELLRRLDFAASARRDDHNLNMIARASLKGDEGASLVGEFCRKLMKGTADYHVRAYHHHDLFAALIRTQPIAALDALFGGDSKAKKNAIRVINDIVRLVEKNPLSGIPDDSLLEWCERNAAVRYPIMASLITRSPEMRRRRCNGRARLASFSNKPRTGWLCSKNSCLTFTPLPGVARWQATWRPSFHFWTIRKSGMTQHWPVSSRKHEHV